MISYMFEDNKGYTLGGFFMGKQDYAGVFSCQMVIGDIGLL